MVMVFVWSFRRTIDYMFHYVIVFAVQAAVKRFSGLFLSERSEAEVFRTIPSNAFPAEVQGRTGRQQHPVT
jgi:hypothetical protein